MTASEPERLLDAEEIGETLRADLARAASHDVGYDVAAGAARFEAALARGAPPPPDGGGGAGGVAAGATGSAAKGLAVAVGLAVVVGGAAIGWSVTGGGDREPAAVATVAGSGADVVSPPRDPPPGPSSSVAEPVPSNSPRTSAADSPSVDQSVSSATTPASAELDPDPARAPERTTSRSRRTGARKAPAVAADDDRLKREMQATDRARQALDRNPARALSLVRKADREFPGGLFGEDREGIAILALYGLGRDDEADRRARAFLRAHPRSSYADKIRKARDAAEPP